MAPGCVRISEQKGLAVSDQGTGTTTFPDTVMHVAPRSFAFLSACFASAALGACESEPRPEWCTAESGEPVILPGAVSQWEDDGVSLRFTELWRAGGLNEGEELAFPISASAAADGRLAIADFGLGESIVVHPDGTWEGSWTRKGEGPGEVQSPLGAAWDEAGNLLIYDVGRHRIMRLSAPRTLRDEIEVPPEVGGPIWVDGGLAWTATTGDGAVYIEPLLLGFGNLPAEAPVVVLRWMPGRARADTIVRAAVPIISNGDHSGMIVPGTARPVVAPAAREVFAVGGTGSDYVIRVMTEDGRAIRTICRDTPPLPLTEIERGEEPPAGSDPGPELERRLAAIRAAPRPDPAPFGRMFYDAAGRLWVQRDRPAPFTADHVLGVAGATFDLFSPSGAWLAETRAPAGSHILAATGDRAYALEESEEGALWIVAYDLHRGPS